jgi:predicted nuclease with TOPRIM domain
MTFEEIMKVLEKNAEQLATNAEQLVALKERQEQASQEATIRQERLDKLFEEVRHEQALAAKQIKQTNKQLGELSNKWGTFTEGMAGESIRKILYDKFGITNISFRASVSQNGESIELDGFGYANGEKNVAVIVEVKSHLRDDTLEQIERTIDRFPKFFPEHAGKKLYSLVVSVNAPESLQNVLRKKGIYLAIMHDDIFKLKSFKNFIPKDFSQN